MMKLDFEKHNVVVGRANMAKALNFGKYKVLEYDMDEGKGATANIEYSTLNYGVLSKSCKLYCGSVTEDDGIFYLLNAGTMISAHVGVYDWLKCVDNANAPLIKEGDEVAILCHSKVMGIAFVRLVRALKPKPEYSNALTFEDLPK